MSASVQAADLRAGGDVTGALALVNRILDLSPDHPRALQAAGLLHSGLGQWAQAEQAFLRAADVETDMVMRARAWFRAGESHRRWLVS
jgi:tetratricopeptide (TPR) repeat protein